MASGGSQQLCSTRPYAAPGPPQRHGQHPLVDTAEARPNLIPRRGRNGCGHRLAGPTDEALDAETIEVDHWQPLLVSGDRVLVGVTDGSSGIGICTILDTVTGQIIATTEPAPYGYKAIAGPGQFLVGRQGYSAFSSTLYDRDGRAMQNWPSHGMMLVDRHGTIRGPESENRLPSRSLFRVLNADGSLRDGPPLSGYYTTYPALDADGSAVFWRDGRLLAIDSGLQMRELFTREDQRAVMSRVLLLDHDQIVLALDDELLAFRNTGLAALDTGPWPCADGNIQGNPAALS
ncbi:MAG TPA: hypothetical protein VFB74_23455 [Kribbellaceae bacterium]|nr:hypothetical protein [Kribbellaceae bacterium]